MRSLIFPRFVCVFVLSCFLTSIVHAEILPGVSVDRVDSIHDFYSAPVLKGVKIDPGDPLSFSFIIDMGDESEISEDDAGRLVKYFLAGLTVPAESLWVNLAPYEKDRVVDEVLGITDMGADMLEQDYVLKQLSSGLTHPDTPTGRAYWQVESGELSKIWIEPKTAVVKEDRGLALITEADMKVVSEAGMRCSAPFMETVEREVNFGRNFSRLRQVYNSLILSVWFKKKFAQTFYAHYMDKNKIAGIDIEDKEIKDKVFAKYVSAFEKGAYNIIRKERDPQTKRLVKRTYFSGGVNNSRLPDIEKTIAARIVADDFGSSALAEVKIRLGAVRENSADSELSSALGPIETLKSGPKRVLLAEDNDDWRSLFKDALERAGHSVVEVADGAAALERLQEEDFEVLVSDIHMPKMNGFKLIDRIRKMGNNIPVLFHSAELTLDEVLLLEDGYEGVDSVDKDVFVSTVNSSAVNPLALLVNGGQKVLLVDDDPVILRMMGLELSGFSNAVETAGDGAAALELLDSGQFDVIITDGQMPRMSGYELIEKIREKDSEIPVILHSGTYNDQAKKCEEVFGAVFVAKGDFYDKVDELTRQSSSIGGVDFKELEGIDVSSSLLPVPDGFDPAGLRGFGIVSISTGSVTAAEIFSDLI